LRPVCARLQKKEGLTPHPWAVAGGGEAQGRSAAADGSETDERPDERRVSVRDVVEKRTEGLIVSCSTFSSSFKCRSVKWREKRRERGVYRQQQNYQRGCLFLKTLLNRVSSGSAAQQLIS